MTPPRFAAVGVVVTDMARSLEFYRKLGLEIPAESDTAPHAEAILPGGVRLLFDTVETVLSFDPDWTRPDGTQMGLAFECESPAAVDKTFAEMVGAGYTGHLAPWDAPWGQRYSSILDPDGNGVDLFAPVPEQVHAAIRKDALIFSCRGRSDPRHRVRYARRPLPVHGPRIARYGRGSISSLRSR